MIGPEKGSLCGRGENTHKMRKKWNHLTLNGLESWRIDSPYSFFRKWTHREGAGNGSWDGWLEEWPLFFSPPCTYPFATVQSPYFDFKLYLLWPISLGEHQYGTSAFPLVHLLLPQEAHVLLDHWSKKDESHVERSHPDLRIPRSTPGVAAYCRAAQPSPA